ncbi:hypothetical protein ElyMa_001391600 [Elysia marginata]|uniref:THAP-type domain-containing protein n=1 Tax=Elysia marginata TaxID=1093978 RepID=A0AAV4IU41_9GAST|nr:hypothetical protein ElyMa_001391600 [Elysia marginata]
MPNICCIVRCSNNRDKEKSSGYFRVPSVITNQGRATEELAKKKRAVWVKAINKVVVAPKAEAVVAVAVLVIVIIVVVVLLVVVVVVIVVVVY